jgi:hypothetical protein
VTDATQRAVLQACDRGVRADRVVSLLDGGDTPSVPREAVLAAVDELRRRHLLLDIEGRLLSVVNARGPRLTTEGFPGGHVALERYRRDLVAAGEAVDGARVPGLTTCPSPRERVCEVTL